MMYSKSILFDQCMEIRSRLHVKCRNTTYSRDSEIVRFHVPDEKVPWNVCWDEYAPINYTHPSVYSATWADPDIRNQTNIKLSFNSLDGKLDRTSFMGIYKLNEDGMPLNPIGRTGIVGRGSLGKWGPNHAADPVVTRWKVDIDGTKIMDDETGRFILQFVAIKRRDTGEWAIPGGMVDAGESVSITLKREFSEEALNSLEASGDELKEIRERISHAFARGVEVYSGYVDDPRNTDNAWMETVVVNFHDDAGTGLSKIKLNAGDDATMVRWIDVSHRLNLYASHREFIALVAKLHNSFW